MENALGCHLSREKLVFQLWVCVEEMFPYTQLERLWSIAGGIGSSMEIFKAEMWPVLRKRGQRHICAIDDVFIKKGDYIFLQLHVRIAMRW